MKQKRVVAVHDISCVGKCSLTVALPILSAAGIETSVIPTAVLSTHTGGFTGYTYRDLTEDILPIVDHWQTLQLEADAIYTGFLGSFEQLEIVSELFDRLRKPGNLILVDPVMADNGELYKVFPKTFPDGMRKLCAKADIIVPNMTEAALLLGEPYQEGPYDRSMIEDLLKRLSDLGPKQVVLTGVDLDGGSLGAASFDRNEKSANFTLVRRVQGYYHGTGDVFASALLAALLNGKGLSEAVQIAVDFTVGSIKRTHEAGTDVRYGVNFEAGLPRLMSQLDLFDEQW